ARGLGLLIGLEFAEAAACARCARRALERGLILNWTLHRDTVVRLAPPLVLTDAEAERALERIAAALAESLTRQRRIRRAAPARPCREPLAPGTDTSANGRHVHP